MYHRYPYRGAWGTANFALDYRLTPSGPPEIRMEAPRAVGTVRRPWEAPPGSPGPDRCIPGSAYVYSLIDILKSADFPLLVARSRAMKISSETAMLVLVRGKTMSRFGPLLLSRGL